MLVQVKYHVTFFKDDIIQHAWLNSRSIKAFVKYKKGTIMKKVSHHIYLFIYLLI